MPTDLTVSLNIQLFNTYQQIVSELLLIKEQHLEHKLRISEIVILNTKWKKNIALSCVKKFTTENNVETKQPRFEKNSTCHHENLDLSSWKSRPVPINFDLSSRKFQPVIKKIPTCHHENLDRSSWKSQPFTIKLRPVIMVLLST